MREAVTLAVVVPLMTLYMYFGVMLPSDGAGIR